MEQNSRSGNGFILGVIVGALVVFLLFTDKGKRILKMLTEEGFEGLTDIIEKAEEKITNEEDGLEPEPETVAGEVEDIDEVIEEPEAKQSKPASTGVVHNGEAKVKSSSPRKFFRRKS